MARVKRTPQPDWSGSRPFEVVRWGKHWALEPLFADDRQWLVAKGGPPLAAGDLVLAVPSHGNRLRVTQVLGSGGDLAVVLKALLHARDIRQGISEEVEREARDVQGRARATDADRVDLAQLPTFTIDPDTARDFDDAISVRRDKQGYRAWVHIADVSYFVDVGGAIDREARQRTSSVYLPLWAEPMLPPQLSSGVCSLVPRAPRKCLTVELTFSADGERQSARFYRSTIVSDHRLTYGFVDELFAAHEISLPSEHLPGEPPRSVETAASVGSGGTQDQVTAEGAMVSADAPLTEHLLLAWELAATLRRRRFARGALRIGSFEPEYRFDAAGRLIGAASRPETPSHALVEEYMLAANEAVAGFLVQRKAHAVYRVHEWPDAEAADALFATLEDLNVPTPPFPEAQSAGPEQVAAALRKLSEMLPGFCAREGRGRLAFSRLLLRSLKQAVYSPRNLGHFGLASSAYLHFTSPIRRYPDLVVHRSLCAHLGLDGGELDAAELEEVAEHCSVSERTIAKLELMADDVALAFLLEARLLEQGWETVFEGEVIGLVGGGLFVHFGGSFQGFLPARRLADERFYESPTGAALVGGSGGRRFRLGDTISVTVERIEKTRGRVTLDLVGHAAAQVRRDRQMTAGAVRSARPRAGTHRASARRGTPSSTRRRGR